MNNGLNYSTTNILTASEGIALNLGGPKDKFQQIWALKQF